VEKRVEDALEVGGEVGGVIAERVRCDPEESQVRADGRSIVAGRDRL
jgi:hypothetical protein